MNRKIWLRITSITITIVLLFGGIYAYSVYNSLKDSIKTMNEPLKRSVSKKRIKPVELIKRDPFSVLMLGVDERKGDRGRSDSIIVITVNPRINSVNILSVPRDTRTEIIGKGKEDKINHAYAFGGVPMAIDTVENFLDIPIDYYIKVNMEGFKDIVDAVGGVMVNNYLDFTTSGYHFQKGEISLDGEKALAFSRMRHEDPRGDFGRQSRQRQIIEAVMLKGRSFSSLPNYSNILDALSKNVRTNLTFNQIVDIQKNYKDSTKDIREMEIKETGKMIDKIYYGIVSPDEKLRVQNEIKKQLEVSSK